MFKSTKDFIFFALVIFGLISLFTFCEPIPSGSVVITKVEYDSLKAGVILTPAECNFDSVNSYWTNQIQLEVAPYIEEIKGLQTGYANQFAELNFAHQKEVNSFISKVDSLTTALELCKSLTNGGGDPVDTIIAQPVPIQLIPDTVRVDTIAVESMQPENLIDGKPFITRNGDRGTRWGAPNYPHVMVFSFNEVVEITKIEFNTFGWDENFTHNVTVFNYPDSIATFDTKPELYSSHDVNIVTSLVYVKVNGGKNGWTDFGEVRFYGFKK